MTWGDTGLAWIPQEGLVRSVDVRDIYYCVKLYLLESYLLELYLLDIYIKEKVAVELEDPYPLLPADDKRRKMSDDEIIEKFVDLTESDLTNEEKDEFIEILKEQRCIQFKR